MKTFQDDLIYIVLESVLRRLKIPCFLKTFSDVPTYLVLEDVDADEGFGAVRHFRRLGLHAHLGAVEGD